MSVVIYYPFSNDVNDYSGNNYHFIDITNLELNLKTGIRAGCLINKGFNITDKAFTNTIQTINSKTVSFWFRLDATFTINSYILLWNDLGFRFVNGFFRLYFYNFTTLTTQSFSIPSSLVYNILNDNIGKWFQFTASFDFTNKIILLYIDSKLVYTYTTTNSIGHRSNLSRIFVLGYNADTGFLNSSLCELIIDSEIWSPAQVKNEYLKHKGILIA